MIIKNWKMNFGEYSDLDCTAPCDMYSVLYNHGYIEDPYYGTNEEKLTQLSAQDCTFYSEFNLDKKELSREKIDLTFYGLDTICDIYFNGTLLDSVINMHRMYEYDIKGIAKEKNEIKLEFKSPIRYYEMMESSHHLYTNSDSIPGAAHLRKALYLAGWDWAPKLPNMGIFRDVKINCYDTDKIEDALIMQEHKNGEVALSLSATTKHKADNLTIIARTDGQSVTLENGQGKIAIKSPRLWWPNGYGKQYLYKVVFSPYNSHYFLQLKSQNKYNFHH